MANELIFHYTTGATLYALLHDATGQIWNGSTFAAPGSANWTDYDIAMTEVATSTGIYRASMPAAAAGVYTVVVRQQAGGSPAVGDITVGSGTIEWDGSAEVALTSAVVADAVWDEASTGHTDAGKAGAQMWTDVDAILADTGTDGVVVASIANGAITAAAIATNAIDADALAADAVDEILDEVIEDTVTMRQALRIFLAALAGKSTGGGTTTITFRDNADTKARISATVDADGNRSAVVLDAA